MKQYVQHISGQGEKWEVVEIKGGTYTWMCKNSPDARQSDDDFDTLYLPKAEYRLCDTPERWVNVTKDIEVIDRPEYSELMHGDVVVRVKDGKYRLRKVQHFHEYPKEPTWAFIVEKREV